MSLVVEFFVPGEPIGKGRARATTIAGRARMYTPAKTRQYEEVVRSHAVAAMAGKAVAHGAIELVVAAFVQIPASWSKRDRGDALGQRIVPTGKPDLSNVVKAVEDALNRVVYADDSQIVFEGVSKVYGQRPGVSVVVRELPEFRLPPSKRAELRRKGRT